TSHLEGATHWEALKQACVAETEEEEEEENKGIFKEIRESLLSLKKLIEGLAGSEDYSEVE
ncbi:hypothetical protein FQN51_008402, partial [Onygenales sp. PD_10]